MHILKYQIPQKGTSTFWRENRLSLPASEYGLLNLSLSITLQRCKYENDFFNHSIANHNGHIDDMLPVRARDRTPFPGQRGKERLREDPDQIPDPDAVGGVERHAGFFKGRRLAACVLPAVFPMIQSTTPTS